MRLLKKVLEKDGSGVITLLPEDAEDLWHAYNLIAKGDQVRATSIRRVQREATAGGTESQRVRTTLTISVESIHYDAADGVLRLNGKNVSENRFVKNGSYHSFQLELTKQFSIAKAEWDAVALDRVTQACDPVQAADAAAVMMQEGLANICLIMSSLTLTRLKVDVAIPKKRHGPDGHGKALERFFQQVMDGVLRHVNFDIVKVVIIASPGFVRQQFFDYMMAAAARRNERVLLDNKGKFVLAHAASGHRYALRQVLQEPGVQVKMAKTKAAGEVLALAEFMELMRTAPARAFYGYRHVVAAAERQALQTLLVTDGLFRAADLRTRRRYVALVELAKEQGADVRVFSSLHVSGEQLGALSGIAAILRFPCEELEELPTEEEEAAAAEDAEAAALAEQLDAAVRAAPDTGTVGGDDDGGDTVLLDDADLDGFS